MATSVFRGYRWFILVLVLVVMNSRKWGKYAQSSSTSWRSSEGGSSAKTGTNAYPSDECSLDHFQQDHWNCETRKFDHGCDIESLNEYVKSSLNISKIHFVGCSLTRNRYMTTALELSGKLPINDTRCPKHPRNLEHFLRRNMGNKDCIRKKYNHETEVVRPGQEPLKLYHELLFAKMAGDAARAFENLQPNDVLLYSTGIWTNYNTRAWTDANRFKGPLKKRPRKGEVIIWVGMPHVGHLKEPDYVAGGQNNSQVLKYNAFMKENYLKYNMDGYIDFFDLSKFADDCARNGATEEERAWANFDGTHATGEPNRMMHVATMLYLKQNLQRLRENEALLPTNRTV